MNRKPVRRVRLEIEYDGTPFSGWQVQRKRVSVQGLLEEAVASVAGGRVRLHGAGRTDAGVHALGQVAHFDTASALPAENIRRGANTRLPAEIVIVAAADVGPGFHARYAATGKLYRYLIHRRPAPSPFWRSRAWHYPSPLNVKRMTSAAAVLKGRRDFAAFTASGSSVRTTERTVRRIEIAEDGDLLVVAIEADGFLYKMARNIVGTLVAVGAGDIPLARLRKILASGDRREAGPTAPACGLYLAGVLYGEGRLKSSPLVGSAAPEDEAE